jgi:alpha-1,6-mannosyltransferase
VFQPQHVNRHWREALALPPSARLLVYAGRFAPEKNLDVLIGAVELLGPPYVLVLIGAGPATPHASARVRVLPYQRSEHLLAGVLAAADVFVHAGDQETFGLALLEAMACGTPVVARAAAGLAELLTPDASVAVRKGTATAFAEAIRSLERCDLEAMGAAARGRALHYDANRVFARLFSRYAVITNELTPALRLEPEFAG